MLLAGRPSHAPLRNPLRLSRYPVSAVGWVKEHLPEGNIFVREEWSGYLLWEMPDRRLFFDAKGGFSPEAMCDHNELVAPGPKWREVMSKYDISTVIVPGSSPLAVVLSDAIDWRRAWTDSLACVYVRTARPKGCGVPP